MKKILALVLALAMLLCVAVAEESTATAFDAYTAAELDSEVTVTAYIQGTAYNPTYGNICLYLADEDGAYYVYRAACDDALAEQLYEGVLVTVKGFKSAWAGEVEIVDATIEVVDTDELVTFEAIDITELMDAEDLDILMNSLVAIYGAEVVAYNEAGDAFSYGWDGSGAAGMNSDLYFTLKVGENTYTMTVESDEMAEGSDAYELVTQFTVGQIVDLEGFLYWYNGAQIHVNKILVG